MIAHDHTSLMAVPMPTTTPPMIQARPLNTALAWPDLGAHGEAAADVSCVQAIPSADDHASLAPPATTQSLLPASTAWPSRPDHAAAAVCCIHVIPSIEDQTSLRCAPSNPPSTQRRLSKAATPWPWRSDHCAEPVSSVQLAP